MFVIVTKGAAQHRLKQMKLIILKERYSRWELKPEHNASLF